MAHSRMRAAKACSIVAIGIPPTAPGSTIAIPARKRMYPETPSHSGYV